MGVEKNKPLKSYEKDERGMTNNSARLVPGPQIENASDLGDQMEKKGVMQPSHMHKVLSTHKAHELHDGDKGPLTGLGMQEVRMGGKPAAKESMEPSKPLSGLKKEKVKEFGARAPKGMGRDKGKVSRYKE